MSTEENQYNVQGYNLVTLLKRLEAATSRLEDITIFQEEATKQISLSKPTDQETAIESIEAPASTVLGLEAPEKPKSIKKFEDFIETYINPFVVISKEIDPLVSESAELLCDAFYNQLKFLEIVTKATKPELSDPNLLKILIPINEKISRITEIKDANRRSEFFNHLNSISEGAPVLGWIVSDMPISLIPEFKDSTQFWSNRVMKEYKDKDPQHVEWVNQFLSIFDALKDYVKEYHTTGPSWNNAGKPLAEVLSDIESATALPAAAGSVPPPPPPPPPVPIFGGDKSDVTSASTSAGGMNAVFADLNKGENITSGLRKVDKSEMTHKNPVLRQHPPSAPNKPAPPKKPSSLSTNHAAATKKKPAKKELVDGTKWIIENFTENDVTNQEPLVIEAEMHQSIYIGNCNGVSIHVKGKANAISVSETRNTGVVVDSLISGIDVIKSYKFGLQVTGKVSMISVDKSDEGNIYLSKESVEADVQIFTSCTTSLNINVPKEDDYEELPVPEQLKHSIKDGKLVSEVVEHAG